MAEDAVREYQSSLADLTLNSKPLINMLTMLAEDNMANAPQIVGAIETHIKKTAPNRKLPALYLVDSILKNVQKGSYRQLISQVIVSIFVEVFQKVEEKTRQALFKLRQTWNDLFSASKLYAIDVKVHQIDPAWPITAPPPDSTSIHINPKFLVKSEDKSDESGGEKSEQLTDVQEEQELARQRELLLKQQLKRQEEERRRLHEADESRRLALKVDDMRKKSELQKERERLEKERQERVQAEEKARMAQELLDKQQELMKLEKQALELELAEARAKLEHQKRELERKKEQDVHPADNKTPPVASVKPSTSNKPIHTSMVVRDPRLRKVVKESVGSNKVPSRFNSPATSCNNTDTQPAKTLTTKGHSKSNSSTSPKHGSKVISRESQSRSEKTEKRSSSSGKHKEKLASESKDSSLENRNRRSHGEQDKRKDVKVRRRNYRRGRDAESSDEDTDHQNQRKRSRSPRGDGKKASSPSEAVTTDGKSSRSSPAKTSQESGKSHAEKPVVKTESDKKKRRSPPVEDVDDRETHKDPSPPAKKTKRDTVLPDDLAELFGKEDTDYRSLPPIPKLSVNREIHRDSNFMGTPKSPHSAHWAQFKADRPDNFPSRRDSVEEFRSPLLPLPAMADRGRPYLRQQRGGSALSPDQVKINIPKPLMLDKAPEIIRQADEQLNSGQLSHEGHQQLLKQLGEMYHLQRELEMRAVTSRQEGDMSPPKMRDGEIFHKKISSPSQVSEGHGRSRPLKAQRGLPPPDRRPLMGGGRGHPRHPHSNAPPRPLLPREEMNPHVETISKDPHFQPWEVDDGMTQNWYEDGKPYSPEHDPRWSVRIRDYMGKSRATYGIVLNNLVFDVNPDFQRKIRTKRQEFSVRLDSAKKEVLMAVPGSQLACYYRLGDPPRLVTVGGVKFKIFVLGPMKRFWIDGHQFEIKADAPPLKVMIAGKEHEIRIDSFDNRIIADGYVLCPFGTDSPQRVKIAFVEHVIEFKPPTRQIRIDNNLCDLDLGAPFPVVMMDGKPFGIRFKGPPRHILINGIPHLVHLNKPQFIKIESNKPHLVAFGGPGHEVIIDDQWFEVKFGGAPKMVQVGLESVRIELEGSSPDVQILGEMNTECLNQCRVVPEDRSQYTENSGQKRASFGKQPPPPPQRMPPYQFPANGPGFADGTPVSHSSPSVPSSSTPLPPPIAPAALLPLQGTTPPAINPPVPSINTQVDVNDLFSKLLNAGIIKKKDPVETPPVKTSPAAETPVQQKQLGPKKPDSINPVAVKKEESHPRPPDAPPPIKKTDPVPDLTEFKTNKFKMRYEGAVQGLYTGLQCTSCGQRFRPEDTEEYREHLDWHFRHNRREKDGIKVAKFRHWYCGVVDWIQFEEMSSLEEKAQSAFFEGMMSTDELGAGTGVAGGSGSTDTHSCPVAGVEGEDVCEMCREVFEQFFDEEEEEWHLKDAVRVEGKTYHPVCYEDAKGSSATLSGAPTESEETLPDPIMNPVAYLTSLAKQSTQLKHSSTLDVPKVEPTPAQTTLAPTTLDPPTPPVTNEEPPISDTAQSVKEPNQELAVSSDIIEPVSVEGNFAVVSENGSPLAKLRVAPTPIVIAPEMPTAEGYVKEEPGTPVMDESLAPVSQVSLPVIGESLAPQPQVGLPGSEESLAVPVPRSGTPVMDEPAGVLPTDGSIVHLHTPGEGCKVTEGVVVTPEADEEFTRPGTPVQDENMS